MDVSVRETEYIPVSQPQWLFVFADASLLLRTLVMAPALESAISWNWSTQRISYAIISIWLISSCIWFGPNVKLPVNTSL